MKTALRPLLVLAFALATLITTQANAAAPMCSSDGRSVIAPPMILPWHVVTLEDTAPCPQPDNLLVQSLPKQEQRSPSNPPAPAPLRAVPVRAGELASPSASRQPVATTEAPTSRELACPPDRPPRN
jgi:hypothetical protein